MRKLVYHFFPRDHVSVFFDGLAFLYNAKGSVNSDDLKKEFGKDAERVEQILGDCTFVNTVIISGNGGITNTYTICNRHDALKELHQIAVVRQSSKDVQLNALLTWGALLVSLLLLGFTVAQIRIESEAVRQEERLWDADRQLQRSAVLQQIRPIPNKTALVVADSHGQYFELCLTNVGGVPSGLITVNLTRTKGSEIAVMPSIDSRSIGCKNLNFSIGEETAASLELRCETCVSVELSRLDFVRSPFNQRSQINISRNDHNNSSMREG